jgi:hypothetical protein
VTAAPTLPGTLRSRINRIAHAAALKHEADMRARLILELQQKAAVGVPLAGLHQLLDQMEATSMPQPPGAFRSSQKPISLDRAASHA